MVELLAAAAMLGAVHAPSTTARHCDRTETHGVIAKRAVCLGEATACRSRYETQYRRYGFRCRHGSLAYDWAALHRPLHVPTLPPGSECPASAPVRNVPPAVSALNLTAFGPGPAYPTLGGTTGRATATMVWSPTDAPYLGWAGTKILWAVPAYAGAVLVRGRQIDGPDRAGFDVGPGWSNRVHSELRLVGPERGLHPAATFVHAAGCYAYQVDTLRRSYVIVFTVEFGFP
jgi:hypothetical protein